ncbi:MAG TPA: hypothetical protein VGP24_09550, partial [Glaciihabitans sp.]|nr:hypothetical protein [Glaciihabitans sp.]
NPVCHDGRSISSQGEAGETGQIIRAKQGLAIHLLGQRLFLVVFWFSNSPTVGPAGSVGV